jgi:hypothetical protein
MSKFRCDCKGKSDTFWINISGHKFVKGPFKSLATIPDVIPLSYYACCSDCGTEFGPGESLEDLEQILKEEGVLI